MKAGAGLGRGEHPQAGLGPSPSPSTAQETKEASHASDHAAGWETGVPGLPGELGKSQFQKKK